MLQSFIEDINWEYPKLGKVAIYKMFCSLKGKHKKYNTFWLWKREGAKFFVSARQMQYFINVMIDYGFIDIVWETKGSRWFTCRIFKASKQLIEYFKQIKDVILTKVSNLSDRIKTWNKNQDISTYLSSMVKIKKWRFNYEWVKYVIWKGVHNGKILNTDTKRGLTLFDFLLETNNKNIVNLAINLKIVWS